MWTVLLLFGLLANQDFTAYADEASNEDQINKANVESEVELLDGYEVDQDGEKESEEYRRRGYHGGGHGRQHYAGPALGYGGHHGGHATGGYIEPGVVRTRVTVQKRILRPAVVHPVDHPVPAVASGVVHRPPIAAVGAVAPPVILDPVAPGRVGNSLLPKCSYINTEIGGRDVGDGLGLTAGSPYSCKQACIDDGACQFWTFRRGWRRDCYLKRGEDIDDVRPSRVIYNPGFVSGTRLSDCRCLRDADDEVCPTRRRGGPAYGWTNRRRGFIGGRFDYDYDYGGRGGFRLDYDDGDGFIGRRRGDGDRDRDRDREVEVVDDDNRGRRRNRNRDRDNDDDDDGNLTALTQEAPTQ